jgi:RHS repeat-associated protein
MNTSNLKTANIYESGLIGRVDLSGGATGGYYERMYYVKDHLGSIRVGISSVTTTNNNITYASDYYPFGETMREYTAGTNKYKFTEKERDNETSYDYFGARYYNNKLGVWLSADPMDEKYPGYNPYNYTLNNPLKLVDPNGMYVDNYTIKQDGSINVQKTEDTSDNFYVEAEKGKSALVLSLEKNDNGLVQLTGSMQVNITHEDGQKESFGFVTYGSSDKRYTTGDRVASLIGAVRAAGVSDLSIGNFSYSNGSSPAPSKSHINGKNGDIRPLRKDHSGGPVDVNSPQFDFQRNTQLVAALRYYGWNQILSHDDNKGNRVPGTRNFAGHGGHFHIQKFNPQTNK